MSFEIKADGQIMTIPPGRYKIVLAQETPTTTFAANQSSHDGYNDVYNILATSEEFVVAYPGACHLSEKEYRQLQANRMSEVILAARRDILDLIQDDRSLPGRILRLVFHDCIGGQCNGTQCDCFEKNRFMLLKRMTL